MAQFQIYTLEGPYRPDGFQKWKKSNFDLWAAIENLSGKVTFQIQWIDSENSLNSIVITSYEDQSRFSTVIAKAVVETFKEKFNQ